MACIFISHSSRDSEPAEKLLTWLRAQGFSETFLDFDKHGGIPPGADWERKLYHELTRSEAVLLVLTKNWFDSKWCFAEFTQARALGKAIFPLIEAPRSDLKVCADIQHLDLIKDREGSLERLATELTRIALDSRGGFAWDGTRPPYPGMLAFDEADAAVCFGRDDDIRQVIERLNARRTQGGAKLVAVLGGSGVGKSSLIRAGVIPRLKRDPRNWLVLSPFRPQLHPLDELAQVLCAGLGAGADWQTCRDKLAERELTKSVFEFGHRLRAAHGVNEAQILITIDQAEELFGVAEPKDREQFLKVLDALLDERLPFLVMMALRSDYLGELQRSVRSGAFEEFSLKPMPLERVADIIEGPARVAGITIDEELTLAAMRDATTEDALPLLAFALRELYDRFASSSHLTIEAYRALGDESAQLSPLENSVRRKAEEVWRDAKPTPEDLEALKAAFVPALVRVNPEGEYVRRPAALNTLPVGARPLLERLAKARLLVVRQEGDSTLVEVVHEALLRKWPLLRGWLDQERLFLIGKQQLEQDLRDWEAAEAAQKNDALLSGLKLSRARSWLVTHPLQLSLAERQFIQASIAFHEAEADRRERFRKRVLQGAIGAALVLGIVTAVALRQYLIAKTQRNRAQAAVVEATKGRNIAESRALASEATAHLDDRPDLALLLSLEARRIVDTVESRRSLLASLQRIPQDTTFLWGHKDSTTRAVFSPDGQTVLSVGWDNRLVLWNAATHQVIGQPIPAPEDAVSVAFSPDGSRFVASGSSIVIWDTASHQPVGEPLKYNDEGFTYEFQHVAFSTSGKLLAASTSATGGHPSRIILWDVATHRLTGQPIEGSAFAFSPDDRLLAVAQYDKLAFYDVRTHQAAGKTLEGHTKNISTVVFSPNGVVVASGSEDKTIILWNLKTQRPLNSLAAHSSTITSLLFNQSGAVLLSGDAGGNVFRWDANQVADEILWDSEDIKPVETSVKHLKAFVSTIFINPDGRVMSLACRNEYVLLSNVSDDPPLGRRIVAPDVKYSNLAFSPDGHHLASSGGDDVVEWNLASRVPAGEHLSGHDHNVSSLAYAPDGKTLVSGDEFGTLIFWSTDNHKEIGPRVNPDGAYVYSLAWSPDAKTVVSGQAGRIFFWDADTHRQIRPPVWTEHGVWALAYSPDGKFLASAGADRVVSIWKAADQTKPFKTLAPSTEKKWVSAAGLGFSPDDALLATSPTEDSITIWNLRSGQQLPPALYGDTESVASIDFSADGKTLASGSGSNGQIRLWDVETHEPIGLLLGHRKAITSVAFSPTSGILASNDEDDSIIFWNVDYAGWSERACAIVNRNLTEAEWNTYMGGHPYRRTCPMVR